MIPRPILADKRAEMHVVGTRAVNRALRTAYGIVWARTAIPFSE